MSRDRLADVMERSLDLAVVETLETMFFTDTQSTAGMASPVDGICSIVRFTGDTSGWLEIRVGEANATVLAANFLGLDPPAVGRAQLEAVCGEMANMICGAMVSIASPNGRFSVSQPEVLGPCQQPPDCELIRTYQTNLDFIEIGLTCSPPNSAGDAG